MKTLGECGVLLCRGTPITCANMKEMIMLSDQADWVHEKDGVFQIHINSGGFGGSTWMDRLLKKGVLFDSEARSLLCSPSFKPAPKHITTRVNIVPGSFFSDNERVIKKICGVAERKGLEKLKWEDAFLLCEKIPVGKMLERMGISSLVIISHPVMDLDGYPTFVCLSDEGSWRMLHMIRDEPGMQLDSSCGFALGGEFICQVLQINGRPV